MNLIDTWFAFCALLTAGFIIIFIFALGFAFYDEINSALHPQYIEKSGKIVAVNGIYDSDTGLFSKGSTSSTSLLFDDGELIEFDFKMNDIILNRPVTLTYYKTRLGKNRFTSFTYAENDLK